MPTVYDLSCTDCDNTKVFGFIQVPFIVLDDGRRKNLSHPGEDRAAKNLISLSVVELRKLGRVGIRNAFVCERCFGFDLFAADELADSCSVCAHTELFCLGDLIGQSESHLQCAKCRSGTLVLVATGIA